MILNLRRWIVELFLTAAMVMTGLEAAAAAFDRIEVVGVVPLNCDVELRPGIQGNSVLCNERDNAVTLLVDGEAGDMRLILVNNGRSEGIFLPAPAGWRILTVIAP